MKPWCCLCSYIYLSLRISGHSSMKFLCVQLHPSHSLSPMVKGCEEWVDTPKGFQHSSKRLLFNRGAPGMLRWAALLPPETMTEELCSFEQNRWKVFWLKWRTGDESQFWNERWNGSHKEVWSFSKVFWLQWICILDTATIFCCEVCRVV